VKNVLNAPDHAAALKIYTPQCIFISPMKPCGNMPVSADTPFFSETVICTPAHGVACVQASRQFFYVTLLKYGYAA
jgi:hypothetical protein